MKRTALITAATLLLLAGTATQATAQNDTATALNATTVTDSVSTQRTDTGTVAVKPRVWFSFPTEIRMGTDMLDYPEFMTFDWNISPGVSFRNGLSIRVPVEYVIGMTNKVTMATKGTTPPTALSASISGMISLIKVTDGDWSSTPPEALPTSRPPIGSHTPT